MLRFSSITHTHTYSHTHTHTHTHTQLAEGLALTPAELRLTAAASAHKVAHFDENSPSHSGGIERADDSTTGKYTSAGLALI